MASSIAVRAQATGLINAAAISTRDAVPERSGEAAVRAKSFGVKVMGTDRAVPVRVMALAHGSSLRCAHRRAFGGPSVAEQVGVRDGDAAVGVRVAIAGGGVRAPGPW